MQGALVTLLDLRQPKAFGGAHIPGAVNIGAGQNLSLWAGWLLDPKQPILLVGNPDNNGEARLALLRVGLDTVEATLSHGFSAWIQAGLPIARVTQLSTEEVQARDPQTVVLDVRSDQEWKTGRIAGSRHIMLGDLTTHLSDIPRHQALITVCGSGYRSSIAASLLQQSGFTRVSSMDGGMGAWNAQKLPVERF